MDSLKKRYFVKLAKSVTDAVINVLLLLFVPRVLGPAAYGNFNFIRDSFQNIIGLSDLNLGGAHINYTARNEDSGLASNVYFTYTMIVGIAALAFVMFIIATGINLYMLPGQSLASLFLGVLLVYLMYLFNALMGLSDSKGATYGFELLNIATSVVLFAVLLVLYFMDALNLTTFFLQRIMLYFLLLSVGLGYLSRKIHLKLRIANPRKCEVRIVIREFFSFAHPLITLSMLGIVFGFFDRWFLQIIYGSVSQGFFSLAFSLSSIAGLFLAPMTPLVMQSVAKADENGDLSGIRSAFEKVKFFYLIGTFLSIFFMFHTTEIIALIGGKDYNTARLTVLVMFLYPMHVVYGQFCGGALMALRKTSLYRDIGLVSTVLGIIMTYVLLAPRSFVIPGLALGSLGLALKLVLLQLFSVTVQLYFVCRLVEDKMSRYLLSQLIIPIPLFLIGGGEWLFQHNIALSLHGPFENGLGLLISIMLWGCVTSCVFWYFPSLMGFDKSFLRNTTKQLCVSLCGRVKKR